MKRRTVLTASTALITSAIPLRLFAQSSGRPPRADQVMWGGMGFSVPNTDVSRAFPILTKALNASGGQSKLALALTSQLGKNYSGGIAEDPAKLMDANSDPALIFTVSLDYEQMILVPNDGGGGDFQLSFVYALAQVLYLDLPRSGGSDGDLRVLYSFPFRVQSGEIAKIGNDTDRTQNFKKLVFEVDNSLVNVFGRKVATKKFREARLPKRLKVNSVTITPEAAAVIKELGISESLNEQFFGQALTASLAEKADISVLPFAQNDVLNGSLASRFNKFPNISKIFGRLNDPLENNYVIDLTVHRALRKSNGSNIANILYARGMSLFIKVSDAQRKNVLFDKKILLIENNELPKAMFDRLKDYDLRYMVQIAIKMFDLFSEAVMTDSQEKIKVIGLDPAVDTKDLKSLREVFLTCRY
ncbi:hypothetical protein AOB54_08525 [beta proteobacterium MWH-UniP1]